MRKKGNKIPNVLWNRIENYTMHICDKFGYLRQHSSCLFSLHYWPWLHVRIQSMRINVQLNFRFVIFLYRKVKTLSYLRNIISTETVRLVQISKNTWFHFYICLRNKELTYANPIHRPLLIQKVDPIIFKYPRVYYVGRIDISLFFFLNRKSLLIKINYVENIFCLDWFFCLSSSN